MNLRKFSLAAAASFVFLIIVNGVFFPLVFPDGPPEQFLNRRPEPLMQFNLLALFLTSVLLSYIYPIGYRGGTPWREGLRFGLIITMLVTLPHHLHLYATIEQPIAAHLMPIVWTAAVWGAAGVVIAKSYGSSSS